MKEVIIITGGSSGIGKEIAKEYSVRGSRLILAARKEPELRKALRECKELGADGSSAVFVCNVEDKSSCRNLIEFTVKNFGRIDILILNAGVSLHAPFESLSEADLSLYEKLMNINFFGYLYCTYFALPHLKQSRGRIGVVGSLSGELGLPLRTGYCASKFATRGFFESLRTEISSDQVHITIVSPGSVRTQMRDHSLQVSKRIQFNEPDSNKMPSEDCAKAIVDAVDKRKENVILTTSGKIGVMMKPLLPGLVQYFATRKSGGEIVQLQQQQQQQQQLQSKL